MVWLWIVPRMGRVLPGQRNGLPWPFLLHLSETVYYGCRRRVKSKSHFVMRWARIPGTPGRDFAVRVPAFHRWGLFGIMPVPPFRGD